MCLASSRNLLLVHHKNPQAETHDGHQTVANLSSMQRYSSNTEWWTMIFMSKTRTRTRYKVYSSVVYASSTFQMSCVTLSFLSYVLVTEKNKLDKQTKVWLVFYCYILFYVCGYCLGRTSNRHIDFHHPIDSRYMLCLISNWNRLGQLSADSSCET